MFNLSEEELKELRHICMMGLNENALLDKYKTMVRILEYSKEYVVEVHLNNKEKGEHVNV